MLKEELEEKERERERDSFKGINFQVLFTCWPMHELVPEHEPHVETHLLSACKIFPPQNYLKDLVKQR